LIEPPSLMIFAHEAEMKIALDTGSEISIGQKEFLKMFDWSMRKF
jgi:hypothetical protein